MSKAGREVGREAGRGKYQQEGEEGAGLGMKRPSRDISHRHVLALMRTPSYSLHPGICSALQVLRNRQLIHPSEASHPSLGVPHGRQTSDTQAGAKASLQLFLWKIVQQLTNNNTRRNSVSRTHSCTPMFAPPNITLPLGAHSSAELVPTGRLWCCRSWWGDWMILSRGDKCP